MMVEAIAPMGIGTNGSAGDHDLSSARAFSVMERLGEGKKAVSAMARDMRTYQDEFSTDGSVINQVTLRIGKNVKVRNKISGQEEFVDTLLSQEGEAAEVWIDDKENGGQTYRQLIDKYHKIASDESDITAVWVSSRKETKDTHGRNNRIYKAEKKGDTVKLTSYTVGGDSDTLWNFLDRVTGEKHDRHDTIEEETVLVESRGKNIDHTEIFESFSQSFSAEKRESEKSVLDKFKQETLISDFQRESENKAKEQFYAGEMEKMAEKDKNIKTAFAMMAQALVLQVEEDFVREGRGNGTNGIKRLESDGMSTQRINGRERKKEENFKEIDFYADNKSDFDKSQTEFAKEVREIDTLDRMRVLAAYAFMRSLIDDTVGATVLPKVFPVDVLDKKEWLKSVEGKEEKEILDGEEKSNERKEILPWNYVKDTLAEIDLLEEQLLNFEQFLLISHNPDQSRSHLKTLLSSTTGSYKRSEKQIIEMSPNKPLELSEEKEFSAEHSNKLGRQFGEFSLSQNTKEVQQDFMKLHSLIAHKYRFDISQSTSFQKDGFIFQPMWDADFTERFVHIFRYFDDFRLESFLTCGENNATYPGKRDSLTRNGRREIYMDLIFLTEEIIDLLKDSRDQTFLKPEIPSILKNISDIVTSLSVLTEVFRVDKMPEQIKFLVSTIIYIQLKRLISDYSDRFTQENLDQLQEKIEFLKSYDSLFEEQYLNLKDGLLPLLLLQDRVSNLEMDKYKEAYWEILFIIYCLVLFIKLKQHIIQCQNSRRWYKKGKDQQVKSIEKLLFSGKFQGKNANTKNIKVNDKRFRTNILLSGVIYSFSDTATSETAIN
ncbi:hypothetical protein M1271_01510 [Patescibacteria group bacterium]|nr:hypothetical protein [Patescibacteria group bacterium]MCL5798093.1 hypothetical protein [Patescibacteria group bacterium]